MDAFADFLENTQDPCLRAGGDFGGGVSHFLEKTGILVYAPGVVGGEGAVGVRRAVVVIS